MNLNNGDDKNETKQKPLDITKLYNPYSNIQSAQMWATSGTCGLHNLFILQCMLGVLYYAGTQHALQDETFLLSPLL